MSSYKEVKHISASSISSYKSCPIRYRLAYVEGIRPAQDTEPLRMGTAWHKGLEVLETPSGGRVELRDGIHNKIYPENRLEMAVTMACEVYETVPDWADPTAWAVEREIVANGLAAYYWVYGEPEDSEYETIAVEQKFDLPLTNPDTGRPTPNFRRVGKIDRIIRHKSIGRLLIQENKSTSKPIDSGSTYWDRLRKDTQSKFYITAARDLQALTGGKRILPLGSAPLSGLLHDVFHKPAIRPKKLTMADSKKFVETGEYCGQMFEVETEYPINDNQGMGHVHVNGTEAEIEPGKKEGTFAIRETPGMYGARLLQDMTTRPEYYFARREVPFTDAELLEFRHQVWALQRNMAEMERTGHWFENEQQCEATFRCQYTPICYNNLACCDGETVPPGFRRLRSVEAKQTPDTGEE